MALASLVRNNYSPSDTILSGRAEKCRIIHPNLIALFKTWAELDVSAVRTFVPR